MLAAGFLFFGGWAVYTSLLVLLFGAIYVHLQFYVYRGTFDHFFPKASAHNVYGVIEPVQKADRQVIISGHHDSACVCRYLLRRQKLFPFRIFAFVAVYYAALLAVLFWSVYRLISGADPLVSMWIPFAMAAGSVVVIPLYFMYMNRKGSPGAGDNLIASSIALQLARTFGGKKSERPLQHTRLILLSTDAEEAGLKGAKAFVSRHKEELHQIPTSVITLECLYHLDELKFTVNDCNGFVKLSDILAENCNSIAKARGYPTRLIKFPFGGGATDAAEFARAGIDACTILGMSTQLVRDGLVYHTPYVTLETIEPAIVEAVLDILHTFVLQNDH